MREAAHNPDQGTTLAACREKLLAYIPHFKPAPAPTKADPHEEKNRATDSEPAKGLARMRARGNEDPKSLK